MPEEKEDIRKFEKLAIELYKDLHEDGYIALQITRQETRADKKIRRFTSIAIDISNKLVKTKEFIPEEQWFILLAMYSW